MVSVIICSAEAGRLFAAANQWRAVFGTAGCDVVTVYRPRSLAAGYNAGLRAAKGELDPAGILNPGVLLDPLR